MNEVVIQLVPAEITLSYINPLVVMYLAPGLVLVGYMNGLLKLKVYNHHPYLSSVLLSIFNFFFVFVWPVFLLVMKEELLEKEREKYEGGVE